MKNQNSAIEQVDRYIRARYPVIGILSHEEGWLMASIEAVAERQNRRVVAWTCTQGLKGKGYPALIAQVTDPSDEIERWLLENTAILALLTPSNRGRVPPR